MKRLLADIIREFGWPTRLAATVTGVYAYLRLLKEEQRLAKGWSYEPKTFYEPNPAARALAARCAPAREKVPCPVGTPLAPPEPALKR
jgi:hypothetical protein